MKHICYVKSNYDDWWKHDGFCHDVTSIGLGYPPPHYGLPTMYVKFSNSLIFQIFKLSVPIAIKGTCSYPIFKSATVNGEAVAPLRLVLWKNPIHWLWVSVGTNLTS